MTLAKRLKFNRWLTQFRYEHSKRGKMVRLIVLDSLFPHTSVSFTEGLEYLIKTKSPKYIINEYKKQWSNYRVIPLVKTNEVMKKTVSPYALSKRRNKDLIDFDKKPQLIET